MSSNKDNGTASSNYRKPPVEQTRLLVLLAGAVRHKKPDKIVFVGKAAAAIAGDAPELAMEWRRRSCSLLLLSPAIGQPAGELCEGEIGRRGAVEQCRHDPG
jgi:hypothetical protein